jgi:hypothetical protein
VLLESRRQRHDIKSPPAPVPKEREASPDPDSRDEDEIVESIPGTSTSKALVTVLLLLLGLILGGSWYLWKQTQPESYTAPPAPENTPEAGAEKSGARSTEAVDGEAGQAAPEDIGSDHVFGPSEGVLLRNFIGENVVFRGVVKGVRKSSSGRTIYIEFSDDRGVDDVCGRIWSENAKENGLDLETLEALKGKMIQLEGRVRIEPGTGRVVIHIENRNQITNPAPPE